MDEPIDKQWMPEALRLAKQGEGRVEPNPMVGAVVVKDGQCIGTGWHQQFGGPHAEVFALNAAGEAARGATLYVTLEPCCHFGKTPPCTELVLQSGVSRVVIAMQDPFAKVAGRGIELLRQAGITVDVGIEQAAAEALNAPYLKRLSTGTPWLIAKWAMTLDGKIATATGDSKWITSPAAREHAQKLRSRVDAIVIGAGTLFADDPLLTARPPGPRMLHRIVVMGKRPLPKDCRLLHSLDAGPVLVAVPTEFNDIPERWQQPGIEWISCPMIASKLQLHALWQQLGSRNLTNVLIEGGATLLGSLFEQNQIDEVSVYIAPKICGGISAPGAIAGAGVAKIAQAYSLHSMQLQTIGEDLHVSGRVLRAT